jgi:hypothetical protein
MYSDAEVIVNMDLKGEERLAFYEKKVELLEKEVEALQEQLDLYKGKAARLEQQALAKVQ